MAEWGEINAKFIDWLKTQDVGFKEGDKDFAPIKYKEQFKLFIEKHDDDENLNMDSFTKTKENKDKDDTLADEMVKDYIAELDKDDDVFKAIDTNGDGEISNDERNVFMDKAMEACFDDNADDFSFKDFTTAVEKIADGDTAFLKGQAAQAAGGADNVADTGNNNVNNDNTTNNNGNENGKGAGDASATQTQVIPQTPEEAIALETPQTDYTPDISKKQALKIKSANIDTSLLTGNYNGVSLQDLNTSRGNVVSQIDTSKADFENYKGLHSAASAAQAESGKYIQQNEAQYNLIMSELAQNNEGVRIATEQISAYENTIAATSNVIDTLSETQNTTQTTLSATQAQIGSLQGQLYTYEEYTDEETGEVKTRTVKNTAVESQIAQLQAQENELQQQLAEISQQLLECQEVMDKTNEELQESYTNLNNALDAVQFNSAEQKQNVTAMLNNKKVYSQATCDMKSAQAGLVAMEGYINSLANELKTIDDAIAQKEQEEAQAQESQEQKDTENNQEKSQEETTQSPYKNGAVDLVYPENRDQIPGLAQITQGEVKNVETSEDGKTITGYSLETDDCTINVNYNPENGEYTYTYDYKDETRLDETVISGANSFTHKVGEDNRYSNENGVTKTTVTSVGPNGEKIAIESSITKDEAGNIDNIHYEVTNIAADGKKETYVVDNKMVSSDAGIIDSITSAYEQIIETTNETGETIKETYKQIVEDSTDKNGANVKTTKTMKDDNVVLDTTTKTETHSSGGSQGGAIHTVTTTTDNLTGETAVEEKTIASNANGSKETTTITNPDGTKTATTIEKDKDGNVVSNTTTKTETHSSGGSQGGAIHTITTTTDNLTGETTVEEKTIASNANGSKETTTITNPDGTKTTSVVEEKAPKEVPETVRLAHDGFDRKTEVTQDGEIYTTNLGVRLAWIEENDQGEYVEKSWTPVHGEEGKYYFVGEPNGETYTVKDLEGNEYTCKKYPNGEFYDLEKVNK